jgi:hypothetical protein
MTAGLDPVDLSACAEDPCDRSHNDHVVVKTYK